MSNKTISLEVKARIAERARQIIQHSAEECRDFSLHRSLLHPKTLILRWLSIDLYDIDHPHQCYLYECFDEQGSPLNCSIHYATITEAERFYNSLEDLGNIRLQS